MSSWSVHIRDTYKELKLVAKTLISTTIEEDIRDTYKELKLFCNKNNNNIAVYILEIPIRN